MCTVIMDGVRHVVTGDLDRVEPDMDISLIGEHVQHPKWGDQIQASYLEPDLPQTNYGVETWLKQNLPNIGAKRARKLVEEFGPELWNTLDTDPEALRVIPGLTEERIESLVQAYQASKADLHRMLGLLELGLRPPEAKSVLQAIGDKDVDARVRRDPYSLCLEYNALSFPRVYDIVCDNGLPDDRFPEAQALYELKLVALSGHTCDSYVPIHDELARLKLVRSEITEYGYLTAARAYADAEDLIARVITEKVRHGTRRRTAGSRKADDDALDQRGDRRSGNRENDNTD